MALHHYTLIHDANGNLPDIEGKKVETQCNEYGLVGTAAPEMESSTHAQLELHLNFAYDDFDSPIFIIN